MGLFDRFKKDPAEKSATVEYQPTTMNMGLFRDITQEVALYMYRVGITSEPGLSVFNNDQGILEGLFIQHTAGADIQPYKRMGTDVYLQIAGMHAFGAGAYVTVKQLDFKHSVDQFTSAELRSIVMDFKQTDELALNRLGIPVDSQNKKVLDQIILTAMNAAKACAGARVLESENIKAYMQVLFNAGISMYMLRKLPR